MAPANNSYRLIITFLHVRAWCLGRKYAPLSTAISNGLLQSTFGS